MSSHPDPGNRTQYITQEARTLTIATPADQSEFAPIKKAFASLPAAKTEAELAKGAKSTSNETQSVGKPGQPIPSPSSQYKGVSGGKVFQASVPSNWTSLSSNSSIKAVPENGYGELNGQTAFTHGVEFGVSKATTRDLREATNAWLKGVAQSNPELRLAGDQQSVRISQRSALSTPLVNPSPLGGREQIGLFTTFLSDGTLFYYLTIAPEKDAKSLQETFQRIGESIRLTEAR
jgi:beta-barrel assembly-enhancing protease